MRQVKKFLDPKIPMGDGGGGECNLLDVSDIN